MELRQIEYFSAVNKHKNYTKAAAELHVSQPTISVAIQKLEDELGICLMKRDNKSITITPEGEIFLQYGEKILQEMESLKKRMDDLKPSAKKHLKVAFPSTAGSWLWKELLYRFPGMYPDIELEIADYGTFDIVKALKSQELEVGYGVIGLAKDDEIEHEIIRSGELKLIVPYGHPYADMPKISINMLENQRIIMYNKGTTYAEKLLLHTIKEAGIMPNLLHVREQSSVFNMVAQGIGIAVVLDDQVSTVKDNPRIVSRSFSEKIEFKTGLLWNKTKFLSSSARKFLDFVREYGD